MPSSPRFLGPSEAASRLGVSAKALRLYERHGLLAPARTAAGWRAYGPGQMDRAAEIVALRRLGLGLTDIAHLLALPSSRREPALAAHQAMLEMRRREIGATLARLREWRAGFAAPKDPADRGAAPRRPDTIHLAFALPWPWGGEPFELEVAGGTTFITGPLGSGKTRLARQIAASLPGATFLGLDRCEKGSMAVQDRLATDPALAVRVGRAMDRLASVGVTPSPALLALFAALEAEGPTALIVDMIEQDLDEPTQIALIAELRRNARADWPLFLMTRSRAILDPNAMEAGESVLYCPANHAPPILVSADPGVAGHELVASCLAAPAVRARTEGTIAWRPGPGGG